MLCTLVRWGRQHEKRAIMIPLLASFFLTVGAAVDVDAPRVWVEIAVSDVDFVRSELEAEGFDVAGVDRARNRVGIIVAQGEVGALEARGFDVEIRERSRPFRSIEAERRGTGLAPDAGYRDVEEIEADLLTLADTYPNLAVRVDLNAAYGTPLTEEGRRIYGLKLSDNPTLDEDEPAIAFIGLHHARELNSIEASFDTAEQLLLSYDSDPQVQAWLKHFEIWIIPSVNPDGLAYVWDVDAFWRKNRRDNGGGAFGVDLNRNYPFQWGECGNVSSSPFSEVYRGAAPLSEPEAQTMAAFVDSENVFAMLTYHSYGQDLLYPYTCATLAESGKIYAGRDRYGSVAGYGSRLASATGEDFEHFYNSHNTVAYLIEMGTSFQPPIEETYTEIESHIRDGWRFFLGAIIGAPVLAGHVIDAVTLAPLVADVSVSELNFQEGERIHSESVFGRYHVILPPGTYTVTWSVEGYAPVTRSIDVFKGWQLEDVALSPL